MAITSSAKKAMRASARKQVFNLRRLHAMRSLIKETQKIFAKGNVADAREKYREAQQAIDKAVKQGVIKERTAARRKAVLARAIHPDAHDVGVGSAGLTDGGV